MSQAKWEVEEVEDKLGAMVLQVDFLPREFPEVYLILLQEVMGQEGARGRQVVGEKAIVREGEGMVMAARLEEVALEVEEGGRVPVEREVQIMQQYVRLQ